MNSLNGITANTKYLGDDSQSNWVSSGQPAIYNDQVLLTMAQGSVGTLLASAAYVWYGKVSATLKTSRGAGVVTAFILLSDVKDEIDFEFVGYNLTQAQSNYYFQGITNYDNEENLTVSDTFQNFHTYEVDWTPDSITWSVDGQTMRTKNRNTTWNATANQYDFPQTPARVQLSLWPAGLSSNGEGTIEWAGGLVDWTNSPDIKNNGYFYATVSDVNVQCYNPPSGANSTGDVSYVFNGEAGTNDTVAVVNNPTVLKSLLGTGTNMSADYPSAASSASASGSSTAAASSASTPETVPGLSGAGTGADGQRGAGDSSASSGSSGASSSADSPGSTATSVGGFSQGGSTTSSNSKSGATSFEGERALQGSLFAGLVALVGMLLL
ncbi:MAG: hypothetical protein M1827_003822 [Pycnora praestabilis]|nr:MAG: hypothetical protein M1827_003822 [Pycnora praestabilis]